MSTKDYLKHFPAKKRKKAFEVALETRKFEIELYWKRATYFWAFISLAFLAYGYLQQQKAAAPDKISLSFILGCLGFLLSFAWFLANRGSKQWQENWEHHVDHLEDYVTGPIFKITLPRDKPQSFCQWIEFIFVGPSRHSVSKINQLISLYVTFVWAVLAARTRSSWDFWNWGWDDATILIVTVIGCLILLSGTRTNLGPHYHDMYMRKSEIN